MPVLRFAAATALALTAAACAAPMTTAPEPAPAPAALAPAPAPAPIPDYDWIANIESDSASLAYGLAESDDVPLMMTCRTGSHRVDISRPAETARPHLVLSSGEAVVSVPVHAEPSELHDGVFLSGEAATGEPTLQAFRRAGWISVYEDGRWHGLAAHPASRDGIHRFFSTCG